MIYQKKKEWEGTKVFNFSNWFQKGQEDCLILFATHRVFVQNINIKGMCLGLFGHYQLAD
jgi:hypothetical protein